MSASPATLRSLILAAATTAAFAHPAAADEVGRFSNDWNGNTIKVEAVPDPEVEGITCHLSNFDRSLMDRMSTGNWFGDPSNASIACRQTARKVVIGGIDATPKGEEVFSEHGSQTFKSIAIRRIYDKVNDSLIYVVYSRQANDASAKTSISTVPLFLADVVWTKGKP